MPKTSRKQIIKDEKKVIDHLLKNSNESIDKIAKKCGFSRQKVWRIIKRLENNKTIWGYTAVVDLDKLNKKMYTVLIKKTVKPITDDLLKKIVSHYLDKELSDIDIDIVDSFYLNGNWDWMISFTAPDIVKAKKFCDILNTLYTEHIQDILLLEQLYANKRCGIPNPNKKQLEEFKANTS